VLLPKIRTILVFVLQKNSVKALKNRFSKKQSKSGVRRRWGLCWSSSVV